MLQGSWQLYSAWWNTLYYILPMILINVFFNLSTHYIFYHPSPYPLCSFPLVPSLLSSCCHSTTLPISFSVLTCPWPQDIPAGTLPSGEAAKINLPLYKRGECACVQKSGSITRALSLFYYPCRVHKSKATAELNLYKCWSKSDLSIVFFTC